MCGLCAYGAHVFGMHRPMKASQNKLPSAQFYSLGIGFLTEL